MDSKSTAHRPRGENTFVISWKPAALAKAAQATKINAKAGSAQFNSSYQQLVLVTLGAVGR